MILAKKQNNFLPESYERPKEYETPRKTLAWRALKKGLDVDISPRDYGEPQVDPRLND